MKFVIQNLKDKQRHAHRRIQNFPLIIRWRNFQGNFHFLKTFQQTFFCICVCCSKGRNTHLSLSLSLSLSIYLSLSHTHTTPLKHYLSFSHTHTTNLKHSLFHYLTHTHTQKTHMKTHIHKHKNSSLSLFLFSNFTSERKDKSQFRLKDFGFGRWWYETINPSISYSLFHSIEWTQMLFATFSFNVMMKPFLKMR